MFCSPKPSLFESPESGDDKFLAGSNYFAKSDDVPMIQALESSSFSPVASPTFMDGQKKKVLTVDTSPAAAEVQAPAYTRSSPTSLAQTPLANAMDVDDSSLLEAFASVSYSPLAEKMRAEKHKAAGKSPVIFEDKEDCDEEVVEYDDSATTATDMLKSNVTIDESFEVESTTTENMEIPKPMLSLEDLNHLMMSDDCVEQYNAMKKAPSSTRSYFEDEECYVNVQVNRVLHASRGIEIERNSVIRKALIEEELGQLIELARQDKDLDEFEPEAVEALGIAAYRLAYHRKYHDAEKSEDVYIPSVAYTVMDGSLLELASQHYFGSSDEFLVTYAGAIGSAIMKQKQLYQQYNSLEREENHSDAEELDISNVSETMNDSRMQQQPITPINPEKIMRLVWGISPKASLMKDSTRRFTYPEEDVEADVTTAPRFGFRKTFIAIFSVLALSGAVAFTLVGQTQMPGSPGVIAPKQTRSHSGAEFYQPLPSVLVTQAHGKKSSWNDPFTRSQTTKIYRPLPSVLTQPLGTKSPKAEHETQSETTELYQPLASVLTKTRRKKSPIEDFAKACTIASSFWKQRFIESKENVVQSWKGVCSFFKQLVADVEVHMFEETYENQQSSNNKKETKHLAFLSAEDFHRAVAGNHVTVNKKTESVGSNSMMKVFTAESFSWNDN